MQVPSFGAGRFAQTPPRRECEIRFAAVGVSTTRATISTSRELPESYSFAQRTRQRKDHGFIRCRQRLDRDRVALAERLDDTFDQRLGSGRARRDRDRTAAGERLPVDRARVGDELGDAALALGNLAQALRIGGIFAPTTITASTLRAAAFTAS